MIEGCGGWCGAPNMALSTPRQSEPMCQHHSFSHRLHHHSHQSPSPSPLLQSKVMFPSETGARTLTAWVFLKTTFNTRVDQIICKLLWLLIAWGMFRRSRCSYDCQFQLQCKFNSRQSDPERNHSHHWCIDTELLLSNIDNDWDHGRLFSESWFWDNGQPFIHCKLYRVFFLQK